MLLLLLLLLLLVAALAVAVRVRVRVLLRAKVDGSGRQLGRARVLHDADEASRDDVASASSGAAARRAWGGARALEVAAKERDSDALAWRCVYWTAEQDAVWRR